MNRQEAQELLPWFVAGTLNEEETRAVQAFIDSGELKAAEVDELSLFAETVASPAADEPAYNPGILKNAMEQLDALPQDAPDEPLVVREASASNTSLFTRLLERMQWSQTPSMAKLALGAQFAAVLVLGAAVLAPGDTIPGDTEYGVVAGAPTVSEAALTIGFAPQTSAAAMHELLNSLDAQIVGGPNSLGMYDITVSEELALADAQKILSDNELILFVQPVAQP